MSYPIKNEAAYERARAQRIRSNASITRRRKFFAENADAQRLYEFLHAFGEFDIQCAHCKCSWGTHLIRQDEYNVTAPTDKCRSIPHPVLAVTSTNIYVAMREAENEWGALSPKQADLVRNLIARGEQRVAERAAAREQKLAADREGSQHIGTVGERAVFTLTVERILSFDGQFGTTYINLCRDQNGNVVVYKGSNRLADHEDTLPVQVTVKATVKAHDERDGVAQTIIARPKEVAA